jgi:hypothetical protein
MPAVTEIPPNVPITTVPLQRADTEHKTTATQDPVDGLDIDELARRLFEPLTRMVRAEIRHDRERAGRSHERRY